MAERLEPKEAARVCAEAAALLNQALALEKDVDAREELASGLASVRRKMPVFTMGAGTAAGDV